MRKVTQQAVSAFIAGTEFNSSNTRVYIGKATIFMSLFGNVIAKKTAGVLQITNAGWKSNTTKERLNGLPGVHICQKGGVWFLNGIQWDGQLTTIK